MLALAMCGGCAIPDYHMPQGFSSTYFRALQHQNAVKSAVDSVIMQPSPTSAPAPTPAESPSIEPAPLYVPQNSEQSPAAWNRFRNSLSSSTATLPPSPSPAPSTVP